MHAVLQTLDSITFAHEMGHTLGLFHVWEPSANSVLHNTTIMDYVFLSLNQERFQNKMMDRYESPGPGGHLKAGSTQNSVYAIRAYSFDESTDYLTNTALLQPGTIDTSCSTSNLPSKKFALAFSLPQPITMYDFDISQQLFDPQIDLLANVFEPSFQSLSHLDVVTSQTIPSLDVRWDGENAIKLSASSISGGDKDISIEFTNFTPPTADGVILKHGTPGTTPLQIGTMTASISEVNNPDLSIDGYASVSYASIGSKVTYTFEVRNVGLSMAGTATINTQFTNGVVVDGVSDSMACSVIAGGVSCQIEPLASNDQITFDITVSVPNISILTASGSVRTTEQEFSVSNNTIVLATNVGPELLGDLDANGIVDSNDISFVMNRLGQIAFGPDDDPADLDHDGKITALDTRILATHCTNPRCN